MKISKQQKERNKIAIIDATVELSGKNEFKSVTMRAIAQKAGLSDAAIYNYFPSKEDLITGYFEVRLNQALISAQESSEYSKFDYFHKIQWLIESHLEYMRKDEKFLIQTFPLLFVQPITLAQTAIGKSKKNYTDFLEKEMRQAISMNEFSEPPFVSFICELIWDFHVGIVYYWLKDNSKAKSNTSQVIQLGLELQKEVFMSNLLSKTYNLAHFLFKEHILSKVFEIGLNHESK